MWLVLFCTRFVIPLKHDNNNNTRERTMDAPRRTGTAVTTTPANETTPPTPRKSYSTTSGLGFSPLEFQWSPHDIQRLASKDTTVFLNILMRLSTAAMESTRRLKKSAKFYRGWETAFNIVVMCVATLSLFIAGIQFAFPDSSVVFSVINLVFISTTGFVTGLRQYLGFAAKSERMSICGREFNLARSNFQTSMLLNLDFEQYRVHVINMIAQYQDVCQKTDVAIDDNSRQPLSPTSQMVAATGSPQLQQQQQQAAAPASISNGNDLIGQLRNVDSMTAPPTPKQLSARPSAVIEETKQAQATPVDRAIHVNVM